MIKQDSYLFKDHCVNNNYLRTSLLYNLLPCMQNFTDRNNLLYRHETALNSAQTCTSQKDSKFLCTSDATWDSDQVDNSSLQLCTRHCPFCTVKVLVSCAKFAQLEWWYCSQNHKHCCNKCVIATGVKEVLQYTKAYVWDENVYGNRIANNMLSELIVLGKSALHNCFTVFSLRVKSR